MEGECLQQTNENSHIPYIWKASVYRRKTRTATCLTYGRQVFTADKQEQPRALHMEGECLQETNKNSHVPYVWKASVYRRNKYSHMPLLWKVSVYTRTATKFPVIFK
jgi:transcriptional regulator NrdR family protein